MSELQAKKKPIFFFMLSKPKHSKNRLYNVLHGSIEFYTKLMCMLVNTNKMILINQ